MRPAFVIRDRKQVLGIAVEIRGIENFCPVNGVADELLRRRQAINRASLKRTLLGIVAFEMAGIDDHAANYSRQAKPNNAPIETRAPPPSRLPTIHPFAEVSVFSLNKD